MTLTPQVELKLVEFKNGKLFQEIMLRPSNPGESWINGIACSRFDLGYPTPRESTQEATDASGVNDYTMFHGSRAVSVDLSLLGPTKEDTYELLAEICHPAKRPYLYVNRPSWSKARRMLLRNDAYTFSSTRQSAMRFQVSLGWTCPPGLMEAVVESTGEIYPGQVDVRGVKFPILFPIEWPGGTGANVDYLYSEGTVPTFPRMRIFGQCSNPTIVFRTIGKTLSFTGLTIDNDHHLDIDVASKTVIIDGDINNSQYGKIDWNVSSWPYLIKGTNEIGFSTTNHDENCYVRFDYRDKYL